jgi:serine/threonine protein kinase
MPYTRGTVLRTAFDTYKVQRKRGESGSGEVLEVKDSEGVRRALKVLPVGKASQHGLRQVRDEFNFGFRSTHKNIAPLLDCGLTGSKAAFYVMPLYKASLRDWISEGIPAENVLRFFGQILDGIEAAHLHGIAHGAIKPENIFVNEDGKELLIADFGIARLTSCSHAPAKAKKPLEPGELSPYAAPEQITGNGAFDQRADIYALGVLLREMFTARTDMGSETPEIGDVAPNFAYLDWTVGRMTNTDASRRLSVTEVKRELIARGHEFLSLQRLNALKTEILHEGEVDDPLLRNPITIQSVDFKGETLYLTLNVVPPSNWVNAFHAGDTHSAAGGHGPNRFVFLGKLAHMKIARGFDPPQLLEFAKLYAEMAAQEHRDALHEERQRRRAQIAAEERRHQVLSRLRL